MNTFTFGTFTHTYIVSSLQVLRQLTPQVLLLLLLLLHHLLLGLLPPSAEAPPPPPMPSSWPPPSPLHQQDPIVAYLPITTTTILSTSNFPHQKSQCVLRWNLCEASPHKAPGGSASSHCLGI
ncbi:hypothetical protein Pcinc_016421 [Petrolisthes cinctipes]|uniref:Uncharacterized protein n=1 Tax=Petrolisthes cinctipes TaxID=88211 RepID=A0AAE1KPS3_PETCI|nr:hypothetical protein Pcinc_016421 [Petrolisthes cinctipes]